MITRIGQEIARPTTVRRLLDPRQPLVPQLSAKPHPAPEPAPESQPAPPSPEPTPTAGAPVIISEPAPEPATEPEPAAEPATALVPLVPAAPPPAPPMAPLVPPASWRQLGRLPWRTLLFQSAKLGLTLGLTFICLSLNIDLPERLIAVYALVALLYRFDSQRTFLIALILLVMIAAYSALGQTDQAQGFAVYTFYFLVIGLAAALRELYDQRQMHPAN